MPRRISPPPVLSVYTSLDPRAQAAAERALTQNLKRLDAASRVRGASSRGRGDRRRAQQRRCGRGGRRPRCRHRRLQSRARCAAADRLAGEARGVPDRDRDRPLQRRDADRRCADRAQAQRRQRLGAAEFRTSDLRPGADGARAGRVHELGDGAARARPRAAQGGRYAAAARARNRARAQSLAAARHRGNDAARGRPGLHLARERRLSRALARGARGARRAGPAAQELQGAGRGGGAAGRGLPARPHADAGDHARHRPRRGGTPAARHRRRRQDRHLLRYPRQLVRRFHRQLCGGGLGGLRRQPRHRAHRRRRGAAGVGGHSGEAQVRLVSTGSAGTRRGSLDRFQRRPGDHAGLQRRTPSSISVPKDAALPAKPGCSSLDAAASPSATMGDKIKSWLKNIVH